MRTATCPSWCETQHAAWDDAPEGHDGPMFGTIGVGVAYNDGLAVLTEDTPAMTPDRAREVACNLYRAAAWVEDQRKA
ncbi:MAG TPA: hypothetical protein VF391_12815 [Dermatophilaceae bacterium]|jgi:hypothetical protein